MAGSGGSFEDDVLVVSVAGMASSKSGKAKGGSGVGGAGDGGDGAGGGHGRGRDGVAAVWDPATGQSLFAFKNCHCGSGGLATVAGHVAGGSAPSIHYLAMALSDRPAVSFFAWGKDQATLTCTAPESTRVLAVSRDGAFLAAGGVSGKVYLWELSSGSLLRAWSSHYKAVTAVQFLDDGSHLITGGGDGLVHAWQVAGLVDSTRSGASSIAPSSEMSWADHTLPITQLCCGVGGSGTRIYTLSADRTLRVRELGVKRPIAIIRLPGVPTSVVATALDTKAYVGCEDGQICSVDLHASAAAESSGRLELVRSASSSEETRAPISSFRGHTGSVRSIVIAQAGRTLISGGADGTALVWDLASRQVLRRFTGHAGPVNSMVVVPRPASLAHSAPRSMLAPIAPLRKTTTLMSSKGVPLRAVRVLGSGEYTSSLVARGVRRSTATVRVANSGGGVTRLELDTLKEKLASLEDENARWKSVNQQLFARLSSTPTAASDAGSKEVVARAKNTPTAAKKGTREERLGKVAGKRKKRRKGQ